MRGDFLTLRNLNTKVKNFYKRISTGSRVLGFWVLMFWFTDPGVLDLGSWVLILEDVICYS